MSGPRPAPQPVQGYTSEPSNVTLNGIRADNADHNQFTGSIDAAPGANTITAVATDLSQNANSTTQSWDIQVPATQAFAYDSNGNLLSDGTRTFTWDAANRLISVSMGVDTWTFSYDGLDRRVTESKNGTLMKKWLWCGTSICEERATNGAVTKRYFTHGEERIGDWDAGDYYYTTDHLGSIRDVTSSAGAVMARYDYDPYGQREKIAGTTTFTCDFGFTGHHTHAGTGLVLTLYRAYDPVLGVWLSADPIEANRGLIVEAVPMAMNLYGYAANSPSLYFDPTGELPWLASGGIGALVGGLLGGASSWANGCGFWRGAASGAVSGFIFGATFNPQAAASFAGAAGRASLSGGAGGLGGGLVGEIFDAADSDPCSEAKLGDVLDSTLAGAATGLITGPSAYGVAALSRVGGKAKVEGSIVDFLSSTWWNLANQ